MHTQIKTAVESYTIDRSHSRVGFTVRHMGFSRVRGSFEAFDGTVQMAADDLTSLSAIAGIEVATITTNEEKRDAHLRSGDFFDAENFPTITFRSSEVSDIDGDRFKLVGDLTMRGVTKRVELDAVFLGEGTDPWGGTRVAFEANGVINRREFGLHWNQVLETGGVLVSENVELQLEIQAVKINQN